VAGSQWLSPHNWKRTGDRESKKISQNAIGRPGTVKQAQRRLKVLITDMRRLGVSTGVHPAGGRLLKTEPDSLLAMQLPRGEGDAY